MLIISKINFLKKIIDKKNKIYYLSSPHIQLCAGVAQLAERLTCNQQVVGSSPTASLINGEVPKLAKGGRL